MSESDMAIGRTAGANDLPVGEATDHPVPSPGVADKSATLGLLRRVFSFPVVLASLLVGAAFAPARFFVVDPDIWWHIKVGDSILRTHQWPTADPYSFTVSGQPWIAYEWL